MKDTKFKEDNEIAFLEKIIPGLKEKKILDLGCGRGEFLIAMKARGYDIVGIEPDSDKHELVKKNEQEKGIKVKVIRASGEKMPLKEASFDFIYCNNVLEHCKNPRQLLKESWRLLKPDGQMYLTVINRFAFRDPHYRLKFINWLPRWLAEKYIKLRGRSKNHLNKEASLNELNKMHYFTFNGFKKIARETSFEIQDLREYKISHPELISAANKITVNLVRAIPFIYYPARLFYLAGFRLLLKKTRIS